MVSLIIHAGILKSSNTEYNRNKNYTERKLVYPQFQFDLLPNYESHLRMRNLEEVLRSRK